MTATLDHFGLFTRLRIDKFDAKRVKEAQRDGISVASLADLLAADIDPYDVVEVERNLMVNGGINVMLQLLGATAAPTAYSNANARICVGDGNGSVPTAVATDTALTATTNRYNMSMVASYPTVASQVITFQALFASGVANFAWNEWGIDSGGAAGAGAASGLLNHKGVSLGTKTSSAAWTATATITES
jgi:hypothetical protein